MSLDHPPLAATLFDPGQRLAVAVSGGADSVALLLRLLEDRSALGLVLSVVHVHHGIRGAEADLDAEFVRRLAEQHSLPFYIYRGDALAAAKAGKETLEEAARELRYGFFGELLQQGLSDAVATAHTLDDQAETVLQKLVRGAWTEGLSGIHPVLGCPPGKILRPFLGARREQIEAWLRARDQSWCEDSTNRDLAHTRNRIRHEVLPCLSALNPGICRQLARLAMIAADEEKYWDREMSRLLPSLVLPGTPVRGGGRSNITAPGSSSLGIDRVRLHELEPAIGRRVVREAARQLGASLSFEQTEAVLALSNPLRRQRGKKVELSGGLLAECTLREILLKREASPAARTPAFPGSITRGGRDHPSQGYRFLLPGTIRVPELGVSLDGRLALSDEVRGALAHGAVPPALGSQPEPASCWAMVRVWRAGDRVTLKHSRGAKKVKEVLSRLRAEEGERRCWPVIEVDGRIVWMRGVELDAPGFLFTPAERLPA